MTRKEAAEKVAKLTRLAKGSSNPHEAESAQKQAQKIAEEFGLTKSDLEAEEIAAAFDEFVDNLHTYVSKHPAIPHGLFGSSPILNDILNKIKGIREVDKAARLRQVVTAIRFATFISIDQPIVAAVKNILDTTLKNHNLSM